MAVARTELMVDEMEWLVERVLPLVSREELHERRRAVRELRRSLEAAREVQRNEREHSRRVRAGLPTAPEKALARRNEALVLLGRIRDAEPDDAAKRYADGMIDRIERGEGVDEVYVVRLRRRAESLEGGRTPAA